MNMRFKKLTLVLAVILMASTVVPALAKSPFSDVSADHWAYDSIMELAAAGLIEGYPDGTFGGSRMLTRYEGAMVFARALARLESKISETDVLAELDQIKAELMAEIRAELDALDVPVETKILEKVVVEKDLDEAALKRIRANEMKLDMLEGDIAYVENRVEGLIHGLRFDMDQLQEQLDVLADVEEPAVELPSLEEIEELIAARIEEGIKEAALSAKEVVKETTVIEKVVEEIEVDGLTEEDVELIAEALIAGQLQKYDILIDETREHLYKIYTRLDAVEAAQSETAAAVKELEKVMLSGSLNFSVANKRPDVDADEIFDYGQGFDLDLNIKASDSVDARIFTGGGKLGSGAVDYYGLEIKSEGVLKRLIGGRRALTNAAIGAGVSNYALKPAKADAAGKGYQFAGLAELDLAEDFTGHIFVGSADGAESTDLDLGLGLQYKLIPELGFKVALGAHKEATDHPKADGVYVGIFGEIAKFDYAGDFALDLRADEDNMLFGGSLSTELGPVGLNAKYLTAQENYKINRPFVNKGSNFLELGADLDFLNIALDGGFYREGEAERDDALVQAFRFGASTEFDLFVPVTVSGEYASNTKVKFDEDDEELEIGTAENTHTQFKIALAPEEPELGFRYGASFTLTRNAYASGGSWKNGNFSGDDRNEVAANLGYKADVRGAIVDLGYGAVFTMPVEDDPVNTLKHSIDLGYNFTKDVKLTLGSTITQKLADPAETDYAYSAGLGIDF